MGDLLEGSICIAISLTFTSGITRWDSKIGGVVFGGDSGKIVFCNWKVALSNGVVALLVSVMCK